jgi:arginyl-tRNA synthetase
VLTYLFRMTHMLSSSYEVLRVVGRDEKTANARMALYAAARQVLYNGMKLLGLSPVDRYVLSFLFVDCTELLTSNAGCKFI